MPLPRGRAALAASAFLPVVLGGAPAPAQDAATEAERATFRADSALVLLDLVVRDKKGLPVRDLRPEEIEVYEDGVRRDVAAFRLVEAEAPSSREATGSGETAEATAPNPTRLLSLTTLILESLDAGAAPLARRAALQFLDRIEEKR